MNLNEPMKPTVQVLCQIVKEPSLVDVGMIPTYAKFGDAGCDGKANIATPLTIPAGKSALVPLGIKVAIPYGFEIQVRPRSGLALKSQITVLNSPGTIDSNYRGEVGAILINHGEKAFTVQPGDRICQLVLAQVETIAWHLVTGELPASDRGEGGFGSTGVTA